MNAITIEHVAVAELPQAWRDREDRADVAGYIRRIRAPRFGDDGLPAETFTP
jgi:hypothetical protein